MRKKVNANGRNIYVYRKGHENKHLGRTFVKYWKEGKVNLPANASHSLRVDSSGNVRVYMQIRYEIVVNYLTRNWAYEETYTEKII